MQQDPTSLAESTVGGLLGVEDLALTLLVGSADVLNQPVDWAHTTELQDPRPYLKARELVCTAGVSLLTAASCSSFVTAVAESQAAGICLGIGDVHTGAPPALVDACSEAGVPLLVMAHGVAFSSINELLVERRVQQESAASSEGSRLLAHLLKGVRQGHSADRVLAAASESLRGEVRMELGSDASLNAAPQKPMPAQPDTPSGKVTVPLDHGHSISWEGSGRLPRTDLLAQIGRVVEIAQAQSEAAADEKHTRLGTLVSLISEGLADTSALSAVIASVPGLDWRLHVSAWPPGTARILDHSVPDCLVADTGETVYLITSEPDIVFTVASSLHLICGLASPGEPTNIGKSLAESRTALRLARMQGQVVGPERLTTLEGLLFQQPASRLRPFRDQLIQPLRDAGPPRKADLVATLRSFLAHDGSIPDCAAELFLHVNTVRHRLDRITTLTGRNPLVFLDRVALTIALWAEDQKPERG